MVRRPKEGDLLSIRRRGTNSTRTVVVTLGCDDIANDPGMIPCRHIDYNDLGYPGVMPERPKNVNALLADLRSRLFVYELEDDVYGLATVDRHGRTWRYFTS
jgi:hypothetical protein